MKSISKIDEQLSIAAQPGLNDFAAIAKLGYRTLISNRPDNEEWGQPSADHERAEAERHGMRFVHIPVAGRPSAADIAAFAKALKECPKPILAHCRSGMRSRLLWEATQ